MIGATAMTVYGYGQKIKEWEFLDFEKDGVFEDENQNGRVEIELLTLLMLSMPEICRSMTF